MVLLNFKLQSLKLIFNFWFKWENCIVFGFDFIFLFKNAKLTWYCDLNILKNRNICSFIWIVFRNSYIMHNDMTLIESRNITDLVFLILLICLSAFVVYCVSNTFSMRVLDQYPQEVTMKFHIKWYIENKVRSPC